MELQAYTVKMQEGENMKKAFFTKFGMKFDGPGVYSGKGDSLLVFPDHTPRGQVWFQTQPKGVIYTILVFNVPFSETIFSAMGNVPTRCDLRS